LHQYELSEDHSKSLDLGCGSSPKNPLKAQGLYGLDLADNSTKNVQKCVLGIDNIPFEDETFNAVTAFDLLEHIPRISRSGENFEAPFIFLMNEVWRVLKKGGFFFSLTPIYPFPAAFQDPTHNNIITHRTMRLYFSNQKFRLSDHYGIKTNFEVIDERLHNQK